MITPSWKGYVASPFDALILFEATLRGLLRHVPRPIHWSEYHDAVRDGNVFIYEEHASGIKTWSDGLDWICCQGGLSLCNTSASSTQTFPYCCSNNLKEERNVSFHPCTSGCTAELVFSLADSSQHAAGQVLKKTFSIDYRGIVHHIISYIRVADTASGLFCTPSDDPLLKTVIPRRELVEQLDSETFSIISALPTSVACGQTGLTASRLQGNLEVRGMAGHFCVFLPASPLANSKVSSMTSQATHSIEIKKAIENSLCSLRKYLVFEESQD